MPAVHSLLYSDREMLEMLGYLGVCGGSCAGWAKNCGPPGHSRLKGERGGTQVGRDAC